MPKSGGKVIAVGAPPRSMPTAKPRPNSPPSRSPSPSLRNAASNSFSHRPEPQKLTPDFKLAATPDPRPRDAVRLHPPQTPQTPTSTSSPIPPTSPSHPPPPPSPPPSMAWASPYDPDTGCRPPIHLVPTNHSVFLFSTAPYESRHLLLRTPGFPSASPLTVGRPLPQPRWHRPLTADWQVDFSPHKQNHQPNPPSPTGPHRPPPPGTTPAKPSTPATSPLPLSQTPIAQSYLEVSGGKPLPGDPANSPPDHTAPPLASSPTACPTPASPAPAPACTPTTTRPSAKPPSSPSTASPPEPSGTPLPPRRLEAPQTRPEPHRNPRLQHRPQRLVRHPPARLRPPHRQVRRPLPDAGPQPGQAHPLRHPRPHPPRHPRPLNDQPRQLAGCPCNASSSRVLRSSEVDQTRGVDSTAHGRPSLEVQTFLLALRPPNHRSRPSTRQKCHRQSHKEAQVCRPSKKYLCQPSQTAMPQPKTITAAIQRRLPRRTAASMPSTPPPAIAPASHPPPRNLPHRQPLHHQVRRDPPVTLDVPKGVTLLGSQHIADYPESSPPASPASR